MQTFETEQERFWAGEFGKDYIQRNRSEALLASNIALFKKVFSQTGTVESVIEFGANIGLNLKAIAQLLPTVQLAGIEINPQAAEELRKLPGVQVYEDSILNFSPAQQWDVSFTKGVLIHINPERLPDFYDRLYRSSRKYVAVIEYYNPSPVEVPYRGHTEKLFKRDFAGELLTRFPDLRLKDYGFVYHRDPQHPQDDLTWFLLEKGVRS